MPTEYIHGTTSEEQRRLEALNRLTNAAFVAFLELQPTDRVLEVGSGLGILAADVAKRVPDGEVVGLEYSLDQLQAVRVSAPNLCLQQGDAHALPFPDESFDAVYCRYLLEHVADPPKVLGEMRRVLKPGGRIFALENDISVNRFDPDCPAWDRVWAAFITLQAQLGGDGIIGRRLYGLVKRAGFREIELSLQPEVHWPELPTFRPWIVNLLNNVEGAREKLLQSGLASDPDLTAAREELEALMGRDDSSVLFHWDRVKAIK
jgi:SAM-dependent methyltransferase